MLDILLVDLFTMIASQIIPRIKINVVIEASPRLPLNHFTKRSYKGCAKAEKIPAKKIAMRKLRIMDKNTAEIKTTKIIKTALLTEDRFISCVPIYCL